MNKELTKEVQETARKIDEFIEKIDKISNDSFSKRRSEVKVEIKATRKIHVDGGAFTEPPKHEFHDAYFTVTNDDGKVIHFEKNIGDVWSGIAEYKAIEWAVKNIKERPLKITSDCTVAIAWAKKGSSKNSKYQAPKLNLVGIELIYEHKNKADQWNEKNHSPKHDKQYYIKRYYDTMRKK